MGLFNFLSPELKCVKFCSTSCYQTLAPSYVGANGWVQTMMRKVLLSTLSHLTAAVNPPIFSRHSTSTFQCARHRYFSGSPPPTRVSELPRADSVVEGCDYNHWLVVMHPPENYPQKEEIIGHYIATLAMALGR